MFPCCGVHSDIICLAGKQDLAVGEDVRFVYDAQRLTDIVIRDEDADAAGLEVHDNALDILDRQRVDTGEWFIQQDEGGIEREGTRDLHAPPLTAGERIAPRVFDMGDMEFLQQRFCFSIFAFSLRSLRVSRRDIRLSQTVIFRNMEASCGR